MLHCHECAGLFWRRERSDVFLCSSVLQNAVHVFGFSDMCDGVPSYFVNSAVIYPAEPPQRD